MRIIAGERRGAKLEAVPGMNTRPTADRVKEGLFNIIQMEIASDTRVLDVFAGTGALGLEALSRGAKEAVFSEQAPQALAVLKRNIAKWSLRRSRASAQGRRAEPFGHTPGQQFDLILLDPPYQKNLYAPVLFSVLKYHLLSDYGILVSEHSKTVPFSWDDERLNLYKSRSYGETVLNFFQAQ